VSLATVQRELERVPKPITLLSATAITPDSDPYQRRATNQLLRLAGDAPQEQEDGEDLPPGRLLEIAVVAARQEDVPQLRVPSR